MKKFIIFLIGTIVFLFTLAFQGCYNGRVQSLGIQYDSPSWAPPFQTGVRYYYLPDIEAYFDLSTANFVYLDNGQWIFSINPPPIYAGYDLFNGFYVALNYNVYQPWMYHQNYLYHYPRFYYKNKYQSHEFNNVRGYNENQRKPVYWRNDERDRINILKKNGIIENKQNKQLAPQSPNYRGRTIGEPVKVRPNMRENNNINQNSAPNVGKPSSRGPR
jgi:hypothetical protein